jgi:hypothetical protein
MNFILFLLILLRDYINGVRPIISHLNVVALLMSAIIFYTVYCGKSRILLFCGFFLNACSAVFDIFMFYRFYPDFFREDMLYNLLSTGVSVINAVFMLVLIKGRHPAGDKLPLMERIRYAYGSYNILLWALLLLDRSFRIANPPNIPDPQPFPQFQPLPQLLVYIIGVVYSSIYLLGSSLLLILPSENKNRFIRLANVFIYRTNLCACFVCLVFYVALPLLFQKISNFIYGTNNAMATMWTMAVTYIGFTHLMNYALLVTKHSISVKERGVWHWLL